jgi:hypothetical protein
MVPFASSYRPIWLGLGTVAFDLVLALVITSLLRARIGYPIWRAIHWVAYLSWPVALVHALGTGTDTRLGWAQLGVVGCLIVVAGGVGWRVAHAAPRRRAVLGMASVVSVLAIAAWAGTGPFRPGWAKRAGTPSTLLTSSAAASTAGPLPTATTPATPGFPSVPFTAQLSGTLAQAGPDDQGMITITISTRLSGAATGELTVVLHGQPSGGGVSLASSSVEFGPTGDPRKYQGHVVALDGDQLVASVRSSAGLALDVGLTLQINPSSGAVHGTAQVSVAGGESDRDGNR